MRGRLEQLPAELIAKAEEKYFAKFTQIELRFLPYLHYLAVNQQPLDPAKINAQEKEVYLRLKNELEVISGSITEPIGFIDKEFYDFVCDCLFYAYNIPE